MDGSNVKMNYSNFFDGNSKPRIVSRIVPANTNIAAGEIVNKGANVGEIAKIGTTLDPTDLYGIALENVTTQDDEMASVAVLVKGKFNEHKVIYPSGKCETDYEIPLRNKGIYFIEIISSEITR